MEIFFNLTLAIIIVIIVNNIFNQIKSKLNAISKQLEKNQATLDSLRETITNFNVSEAKPSIKTSEIKEFKEEIAINIQVETKPIEAIINPDLQTEEPLSSIPDKQLISLPFTVTKESIIKEKRTTPPKKTIVDWEKFIGENLINKIGIAILTIGIGIFVKYAIDNHWINEIGRVCIGLLAGGILLGTAHYLRQEYKAFSSVLVGGGIAILYFTIGITFHEYHLLSQTLAFICMVVITLFAVLLSIGYNRMEIAVIALIGGFATPFMVSSGAGNYMVLFSYLIILNTGMLLLSNYKKWNLVYIISYIFTILIYGIWFIKDYLPADKIGALCFGSAFYFLFFTAATIFNLRKQLSFVSFDFLMILSLNVCYYSLGINILSDVNDGIYKGLFTIALASINFGLAYMLFRNQTVDRNFVYLIIALVLTYITLIAPIQLNGNQITLFWAAEAVILLWLSQKSGIFLMKVSSFLLWPLMLISLILDWIKHYDQLTGQVVLWPIANQPFITGVGVLVSMGLFLKLLKNEKTERVFDFHVVQLQQVIAAIMVILAFFVGILEVNYHAKASDLNYASPFPYVADYAYISAFLAILWLIVAKKKLLTYGYAATMATGWFFAILIILINGKIIETRNMFLFTSGYPIGFFLTHYIMTLAIIVIIVKVYQFLILNFITLNKIIFWALGTISIFVLSMEIDHAWIISNGPIDELALTDYLQKSQKVLYPIFWGLSSFVLIYVGLKKRMKEVRIFALALFGLILLKLFTIDIIDMSAGGRIAAFISLGILLLVMSFLYQKLKKLLIDNE